MPALLSQSFPVKNALQAAIRKDTKPRWQHSDFTDWWRPVSSQCSQNVLALFSLASNAFSNLLNVSHEKRFENIWNVWLSIWCTSPIRKIRVKISVSFIELRLHSNRCINDSIPVLANICIVHKMKHNNHHPTQNFEGMEFTVVSFGQGYASMSPPTKELPCRAATVKSNPGLRQSSSGKCETFA